MEKKKQILENIKTLIQIKGENQDVIADALGIKQSALSLILKGKRGLSLDKLLLIANCFQMDLASIINYHLRFENELNSVKEVQEFHKKKYTDIDEANFRIHELETRCENQIKRIESMEKLLDDFRSGKIILKK